MGYYKESHHAKSYEVMKGVYCCCDLASIANLESMKDVTDVIGDRVLLNFNIPDEVTEIDGYLSLSLVREIHENHETLDPPALFTCTYMAYFAVQSRAVASCCARFVFNC